MDLKWTDENGISRIAMVIGEKNQCKKVKKSLTYNRCYGIIIEHSMKWACSSVG